MSQVNSRNVTLERDVRAFMRAFPNAKLLSHHHLIQLKQGQEVVLGETQTMTYDHKDQQAAQVIGADPERFVILAELEDAPWQMAAISWPTQSTR